MKLNIQDLIFEHGLNAVVAEYKLITIWEYDINNFKSDKEFEMYLVTKLNLL